MTSPMSMNWKLGFLLSVLILFVGDSFTGNLFKGSLRAQSGRLLSEFDGIRNWDSFPQFFKPFFTDPKKNSRYTPEGVLFQFQPGAASGFAGMESDANLVGNFEIEIQYDISQFPEKIDQGYGASFGIWVKADAEFGDAAITRIVTPWAGQEIRLTRAVPQGSKTVYAITGIPSKAKKGRLMLRRVGNEVIALSADSPQGEFLEWARFPFTNQTIRKVRLTSDTGGAPIDLACRVFALAVRQGDTVPTEPGKPGPKAHISQPMPEPKSKTSSIPTLEPSQEPIASENPKAPFLGSIWFTIVVGLVCLGVGIAIGRKWHA